MGYSTHSCRQGVMHASILSICTDACGHRSNLFGGQLFYLVWATISDVKSFNSASWNIVKVLYLIVRYGGALLLLSDIFIFENDAYRNWRTCHRASLIFPQDPSFIAEGFIVPPILFLLLLCADLLLAIRGINILTITTVSLILEHWSSVLAITYNHQ